MASANVVWILTGWAALVLVLLIVEPALWRATRGASGRPARAARRAGAPTVASALIAALVVVPISVVQHRGILWPEGYTGQQAAVVARLHSLPADALVISDDPGLVSARRPAASPGDLADASFQRIDAGEITAASLVACRTRHATCAACSSRRATTTAASRPSGIGCGRTASSPSSFGDDITLYARPGCDPS